MKLEASLERDCGNGNFVEQIEVEGLDIHIFEHLRLELPCLVIDFLKVYELCILHLLPLQQPFLVRPHIYTIICMLVADLSIC